MNWIIILLIVGACVAYIVWPLRRNTAPHDHIEYSTSEYDAPVDAQTALQQLDFDLSMGKIDDEEHRQSRAELSAEIVDEVASDKVAPDGVAPTAPSSHDADLEAEILIARARRRKRETPATTTPAATWTCGVCGREMRDEDRFCASCGAARVMETIEA